MSIIIYNPTNETFEMTYGGRTLFLGPNEKAKVEDAAGHHLLNGFTARGLCSLEFGDDEAVVKEQGMARNKAFRTRMVGEHNHRNLQRKQVGLAYLEPTSYIVEAAKDLGLELDQPYAQRDAEKDRLLILEKENRDLKADLADAMDFIREFRREKEAAKTAPAAPAPQPAQAGAGTGKGGK